jgi:hypothetical protein
LNIPALFLPPHQLAHSGVVPSQQYYRLNTAYVGSNATGAQSIFGVGVSLSANTVYSFECSAIFTKTAGTTSHTMSSQFGGTATINNILYFVAEADNSGAIGTRIANSSFTTANVLTATTFTGAMTSG